MSHSYSLNVRFTNDQAVEQINALKDDLNVFLKKNVNISKTFENEIAEVLKDIDMAIAQINSIGKKTISVTQENVFNQTAEARLEFDRKVDSFIKRIENLKKSLNFSKEFNRLLIEENEMVKKTIIDNGIIGIIAAREIEKSNQTPTFKILTSKIDELRTNDSMENEIKMLKSANLTMIKDAKFPEEFKVKLAANNGSYKTIGELSELVALITSMELRWKERKIIITSVISTLKTMGFSVKNTKYEVATSLKGLEFLICVQVQNAHHNKINMIFDLNGKLEYKMGNYEGHMCEANSESLRKQIKSRYFVENEQIIRNVSNAKPLSMAMKVREDQNE